MLYSGFRRFAYLLASTASNRKDAKIQKTGKHTTSFMDRPFIYILISINDSRQFFEQGCCHLKSDQNQDAISVAYSLLPHSR